MAGRPITKARRVRLLLKRLLAIEDQLIDLLPDQYGETADDDDLLPFDDLGASWRRAADSLSGAVERVEWLEHLLNQKALRARKRAMLEVAEKWDAPDDPAGDEPGSISEAAADLPACCCDVAANQPNVQQSAAPLEIDELAPR